MVNLRLRTDKGAPVNVTCQTQLAEVTTFTDTLPRHMVAAASHTVEVRGFSDLLRMVRALNPAITEAELKRAIQEQTVGVGEVLTAG